MFVFQFESAECATIVIGEAGVYYSVACCWCRYG